MKVEVFDTKTDFDPVTFKITCETEEELIALYHRINISENQAYRMTNQNYPKYSPVRKLKPDEHSLPMRLFRVVKEALLRRGLYKKSGKKYDM